MHGSPLPGLAGACLALGAAIACGPKAPPSPHDHAVEAGRPVHWGYGEDDGPVRWASLSTAYRLCAVGRAQSPVDLGSAVPVAAPRLLLDYAPAALQISHHEHVVDVLDNGHTIQVSYDDGSTLTEEGRVFELVQYHFHAPSEHTVNGRSFPMEMHLVHKSDDGGLAVLAVLVEEGSHNVAFDPIWGNLPRRVGESQHLEGVAVDIDDLLPDGDGYYRYHGSLTTPPCTEGVRWFVSTDPIELSTAQIEAFTSIVNDNNRPTQPLHGRRVAAWE